MSIDKVAAGWHNSRQGIAVNSFPNRTKIPGTPGRNVWENVCLHTLNG